MNRISKRGKKILAMVLVLVLIAGLLPNTALFEGWNVQAWAAVELNINNVMDYFDVTYNLTYTGETLSAVSPKSGVDSTDHAVAYYKQTDSGAYETDASALIDAGTYQIVITPNLGHAFMSMTPVTLGQAVTVDQLDLSAATITVTEDAVYTGNQLTPDITVEINDNTVNTDFYSVSYGTNVTAGTDAGSVTITPTTAYSSNVTGPKTQTFTITAAQLSVPGNLQWSGITTTVTASWGRGNKRKQLCGAAL